jgi:hypothetical protein
VNKKKINRSGKLLPYIFIPTAEPSKGRGKRFLILIYLQRHIRQIVREKKKIEFDFIERISLLTNLRLVAPYLVDKWFLIFVHPLVRRVQTNIQV